MSNYHLENISNYRKVDWDLSPGSLYLTDIPEVFEPFEIRPNYFAYGLVYCGKMLVEVDDERFEIDSNSLFIYRPEQRVKILYIAPKTKGAFVLFTKKFIDQLFDSFFTLAPKSFLQNHFGSYLSLLKIDHKKMTDLFSKIMDFLSSISLDINRWAFTAKNLLLALINETDLILERYKSSAIEPKTREIEVVTRFKKLVAVNYAMQRKINFYAMELNLSANYLHKIVRSQCKHTPYEIINQAVLSESKSMLCYSKSSIGEIADKLNFASIQSFSKYFKKHTGYSPSAFKANNV